MTDKPDPRKQQQEREATSEGRAEIGPLAGRGGTAGSVSPGGGSGTSSGDTSTGSGRGGSTAGSPTGSKAGEGPQPYAGRSAPDR